MSFKSEFELVPLGDVAQFINGDRSSNYPKGDDYIDNGTPFISAADIGEGRVDYSCVRRISGIAYERLRGGKIQRNDVLFCLRGSIGKIAYVREQESGAIASSLVIVRATGKIDSRYLFFSLSSQAGQQAASGLNNGAAQPNLSVGEMQKIRIPLPLVPIQRRIASILSAYDDLIENHRKRIAVLEEMARRLYREWFVHFRYPGHEAVPLVDSLLGRVPQGWEVRAFASLAEYRNGYAFKPDDWGSIGIPIIKIKELKAGVSSETPRNSGASIQTKYHFDSGAILFSWSADLDTYLWSGGPGLLNQHLFLVIPSPDIHKDWLFHGLKEGMPRFRSLSLGATMHHIKRSALDQVSTLWPGRQVADSFGELVKPLHDLSINLQSQVAVLRRTRDLLLPRLMSGALSVEALATAEAAVP